MDEAWRDEEEEVLLLLLVQEEERRVNRPWIRRPILRRDEVGEFRALMAQERNNPGVFHSVYRMSPERFDELAQVLEPALKRQDTNYRAAISPPERLALTLRFVLSQLVVLGLASHELPYRTI